MPVKEKGITLLRKEHNAIELQSSNSQSMHSEAIIASTAGQELRKCAGRAPPINIFMGESPELFLED